MTRDELLERLKAMTARGEELLPEEKAIDYLESFLTHIGDPDPELRDELIYPYFCDWVSEEGHFSHELMADLLDRLSGLEHMHYKLGETGTDSVFRRSFSALFAAVILNRQGKTPFLSQEQLLSCGERAIDQFLKEKDLRGYEDVKGWAHSQAHTADVFKELLVLPEMETAFLKPILSAITQKIIMADGPWTAEEDERLVTAVSEGFFRLDDTNSGWIENWILEVLAAFKEAKGLKRHYMAINGKAFMRSLYFRGVMTASESPWLPAVFVASEALNRHC